MLVSGNFFVFKLIYILVYNEMEVSMNTKKFLMLLVLAAVLVATFATTSSAFAAAGCGSSVTVVKGDTLRKIADRCGTTVSALSGQIPRSAQAI